MNGTTLIRCFLAAAVAALAGLPAAAAEKQPPNVVFILVDDLRWDALGCTGHQFAKTPNIDRIAKEGAILRNAFVTTPLCAPSRASFLTGQYVHTHGVKDNTNHNALSHKLVTWPKLLQDAGYETAYVGKWHMGNDDSPRPGFDRWVSFKGQGRYQDPPLNIDGKAVEGKGYITDLLNEHAVEFVKKEHQKPFAVCLAHKAVHGPFTPSKNHEELYKDDKYTPPESTKDTQEGKPVLKREVATPPRPMPKQPPANQPRGAQAIMRNQLRCLASIDDGVGALLKALEETKQLDNTLFIFTSDNGYFWGEHKLGDKRAAYEESIRIPMLVRYPAAVKAGTKIEDLALNIDVAATVLDATGVKVPAEVEGRSLLPILRGDAKEWRPSIAAEYFEEKQYPRIPTWQAVRNGRWKFIHYPGQKDSDELYDLQKDPLELKNLINEESAAATLKGLKAELEKRFK